MFFPVCALDSESAVENVCYECKCWKGTDTRVWTTFAGNSEYAKRMQCVTSSLPLAPPESRLECCYIHALCCWVRNRGCHTPHIGTHKTTENHIFLLINKKYSYTYTIAHVRTLAVHTHQNTHTERETDKHAETTKTLNTLNAIAVENAHAGNTSTYAHFCWSSALTLHFHSLEVSKKL